MKVRRQKGYFSISAVAKMFSVHQQTVRMYEKQGFVTPKRSAGNTRLFSEEDIDRLEEIIYLTHELGINLAGVEMILKLKKQIGKMQEEMNKLFEGAQKELDKAAEEPKRVVQQSAQKLIEIKNRASRQKIVSDVQKGQSAESERNDDAETQPGWKVYYERNDQEDE